MVAVERRWMAWWSGAATLLAGWLLVGPAVAQDGAPAKTEGQTPTARPATVLDPPGPPDDPDAERRPAYEDAPLPESAPLEPGQRRELPDYDGRAPAPASAAKSALWLPRILFSPLYVVSEFVVRQPIGYVVTQAEKHKLPSVIIDALTFGPDRRAGIVPTALVDFGFRPSVGVLVFVNDAFAKQNDLRVRAAWGGRDWKTFALSDYLELTDDQQLRLRAAFTHRPDWVFHGLGPDSGMERARYSERRYDAAVEYRLNLWRSSSLNALVGVRDSAFDASVGCCDEVTVERAAWSGRFDLPEGVNDGYTALHSDLQVALDSRPRRHLQSAREGSDFVQPPGTGVRLAGRVGHGGGLREIADAAPDEPARYAWVRYGGTLGGFVDLTNRQRVVGVQLVVDFVDPVADSGRIPFTELVSLGGKHPMRGYLEGRLRGRSAAVAVLEYQWPIWVWLDGKIQYELGNVFGRHLDGFELDRLRQSFGLGLAVNNAREHAFEVLLGAGTRTFDEGSELEHLRFVVGASSGF